MASQGFYPCQKCRRIACCCLPESPPDPEVQPKPATKREAHQEYAEAHTCVSCIHSQVCEVGRHTAELYLSGWQVTISDCTQFLGLDDVEGEDS